MKKLQESNTLYIGNLNLASTKSDIHQLFANAGTIKTIIMGLDKKTLSPAGFCFIEYVKFILICMSCADYKLFNNVVKIFCILRRTLE